MKYYDAVLKLYFGLQNMPNYVFGNSSKKFETKFGTTLSVQKPCSRTIFIESNLEEDIHMKNQFKIRN